MRYNHTIFPSQKMLSKDKTEKWQHACVDYIVGMGETVPSGQERTNFEEMQILYDLYNSIFNEKDLLYVTDPFKQDDGFPASPQNFNIIKPKIDLLLGEESKYPFNFKVLRTSQDSVSDAQDKMKQMVMDYVMASAMAGMDPAKAEEYQKKLQSGEIMPPEKIQKYISESYKDVAESSAYHTLNYLKEKLNLQHEFHKGFKDALIAGKEVYYVGVLNGEPHAERVNPLYFAHDMSPDIEFIEDGDWACRRMRMSYTEVYDRLFDKMDEQQLNRLLELTGQNPKSGRFGPDVPNGSLDFNHWDMHNVTSTMDNYTTHGNQVNLWHATWKSYKKIGFVKIADENGQVQEIVVSEDYMKIGNELSIEWKWVVEVWEGYRIGSDLYVGIQPLEYQHISADNLNSQKLPYCGVLYNNSNTQSKSLVSIMRPLQYMYIIAWYRLELAMARDKGKVINMDLTQIPKSMNIDVAKWMHYLSAIGVNFINPYEEGWDIPGREGGKPSQFNQITALDLTMANVIDQYIKLMSKIEDMVSEISGVSRQRQGEISPSELVGNVQAATANSADITASLFWMHNQCKRNLMTMVLNTSKEAWKNSNKTKLQYIFDDATRAFITLSDNFFYEDFDIFVSNSSTENRNIETLKSLYQPAMQNGASLLDIAEVMTLENVSEIKNKLKSIEQKRAEQMQAQAEQENQAKMEQIQMQNQYKQQEIEIEQQKLSLEKYKIDTDNQTKITLAEIDVYKFQQELDQNGNGIPDPMEIADLGFKRSQLESDAMDKQLQAMQKERELMLKNEVENKKVEASKEIENKKIAIEEKRLDMEQKRMEHESKLQSLKEKAAMEREKLKAKTALKNKTVGEK